MHRKRSAVSLNRFSADPSIHLTGEFPAFIPVLTECVHFLHKLPAARKIAAGTLLIEQGCMAATVYLIESGLVKLVHVSECGREITTGLRSTGWYAGYTAALLKTPSVYSVIAVTDCQVVKVSAADFSNWFARDTEMRDHFVSVMCLEVASQASFQAEVMSNPAEHRLEHFMRERVAKDPSRMTLDPLPELKQMELAQLLAVTPEHLSRMMKKKKNAAHRESRTKERPGLPSIRDEETLRVS